MLGERYGRGVLQNTSGISNSAKAVGASLRPIEGAICHAVTMGVCTVSVIVCAPEFAPKLAKCPSLSLYGHSLACRRLLHRAIQEVEPALLGGDQESRFSVVILIDIQVRLHLTCHPVYAFHANREGGRNYEVPASET